MSDPVSDATYRWYVAWSVLPLSVLVFLINRNRLVDMVAMVFGVFALGYILVAGVMEARARKILRDHDRRINEADWSIYSRPLGDNMWEIGLNRVAYDGTVVQTEPATRVLREDDHLEILVAEEEVRIKARRWNMKPAT
jgi:hypothetical protein